MACTCPTGCDCMDHNTDCRGCYWYRNTSDNDKRKDDKDE